MSRFSKRRRGKSDGIWRFALGGLLIFVALGALGGIAFLKMSADEILTLDKATLCPVNGARGITVALIDTSDDLPDIGKREVMKLLNDAADKLPSYHLLEIRTLDPAVAGGHILFSKCNPGNGANLSEITRNPEMAKRRWKEDFQGPLQEAFSKSLTATPAKLSPIMAAIQRIAVDHFTGHSLEALPHALIIVSDMIENTPDYDQYRGDLSFDRFKKSRANLKFRTDLKRADVTIRYIQRATSRPIDSGQHIQFWQSWVKDNNGQIIDAAKLQGVG